MSFEAISIRVQKRIHQPKELHDSFVLADIFVALQTKSVGLSVISSQGHLSWSLFGGDDVADLIETLYADDRFTTLICARHGKLQILGFQ